MHAGSLCRLSYAMIVLVPWTSTLCPRRPCQLSLSVKSHSSTRHLPASPRVSDHPSHSYGIAHGTVLNYLVSTLSGPRDSSEVDRAHYQSYFAQKNWIQPSSLAPKLMDPHLDHQLTLNLPHPFHQTWNSSSLPPRAHNESFVSAPRDVLHHPTSGPASIAHSLKLESKYPNLSRT